MPTATAPAQQGTTGAVRYMQGIAVPEASVRPPEFFARTRRQITTEKSTAWAGFGQQDYAEIRKAGVISALIVKFSGSLVITGTGVSSTYKWPYDLIQAARFTANGQSNIINASGLKLKAREIMSNDRVQDRGVQQTVSGATVDQGTLSTAAESWGVGSSSALTAGTYDVELVWMVPVAEDEKLLHGAIFAQTSTTDLNLILQYEQIANLFTGYTTAPTLTGTITVESVKFSVPIGTDGQIVVPDLSAFHSLIQTRVANGLSQGDNELRLLGQGAGKALLRTYYQVLNGNAPGAPLQMNASNFGRQAWRYAGNETPDEYLDGRVMRYQNERQFNSDIGAIFGFGCHDFVQENAFRDSVDMGSTSELRLFINIAAALSGSGVACEYVVETMFSAGAGS